MAWGKMESMELQYLTHRAPHGLANLAVGKERQLIPQSSPCGQIPKPCCMLGLGYPPFPLAESDWGQAKPLPREKVGSGLDRAPSLCSPEAGLGLGQAKPPSPVQLNRGQAVTAPCTAYAPFDLLGKKVEQHWYRDFDQLLTFMNFFTCSIPNVPYLTRYMG